VSGRPKGGLEPIVNANFLVCGKKMRAYGIYSYPHLFGDFFVAETDGDKGEDLFFAIGQRFQGPVFCFVIIP
jgi:hypothetical protein